MTNHDMCSIFYTAATFNSVARVSIALQKSKYVVASRHIWLATKLEQLQANTLEMESVVYG